MFKRKKDKTIIEMFEEKKFQEQARKELYKNKKIDEGSTIIVERKSKIISVLYILLELFRIIFRIVLIIIVCVLATIGGTVIMNSSLREYFIQNISLIK